MNSMSTIFQGGVSPRPRANNSVGCIPSDYANPHQTARSHLVGVGLYDWFDESCYDALYLLLTSLPVEGRLELLSRLEPPYSPPGERPLKYPLAARMFVQLFDDLSHLPDKFGRSALPRDWLAYSVANLAALRAAEAMGLAPAPPPNAGEDSWARYRSEIRKKVSDSPPPATARPDRFLQTP
ncbi:MAG: hypothetical protein CNCCGFBP_02213 [Fimbriimonadaceae bacterium]|nr:hypothetical protein [Fimbriimonadaceae bacterium]